MTYPIAAPDLSNITKILEALDCALGDGFHLKGTILFQPDGEEPRTLGTVALEEPDGQNYAFTPDPNATNPLE